MSIQPLEALIIVAVALVFFGTKKLPMFGAALGKTIREFKRAARGFIDDEEAPPSQPSPPEAKAIHPQSTSSLPDREKVSPTQQNTT